MNRDIRILVSLEISHSFFCSPLFFFFSLLLVYLTLSKASSLFAQVLHCPLFSLHILFHTNACECLDVSSSSSSPPFSSSFSFSSFLLTLQRLSTLSFAPTTGFSACLVLLLLLVLLTRVNSLQVLLKLLCFSLYIERILGLCFQAMAVSAPSLRLSPMDDIYTYISLYL